MPGKKLYLEQHLDEVRTLPLEPHGDLLHSASIVLPLVIGHGHHGR